jgi:molybdopterin/thiamine biosynthesis adenylyltransferase
VAWYGPEFDFVAEDDDTAQRWLAHRFGAAVRELHPAWTSWVEHLPPPSMYPQTPAQARALLPDIAEQFDRSVVSEAPRLLVLVRGLREPGTFGTGALRFGPASMHGWTSGRRKGFRPGRRPAPAVDAGKWRLERAVVFDVNAAASRRPLNGPDLSRKRVAFIGAGSLGSGVAQLLIQSGLGRATLIDPDTLGFENIGRHELGADEVGRSKVESLARRLRAAFPQVSEVDHYQGTWFEYLRARTEAAFDDVDLILCATGDWNSESALSDFQRARGLAAPAVYAWMENNGAAAHLVALGSDGPCLRCGFDATGNLSIPITRWIPGLERSIGCAAPTSSYGAIELGHIQALAARTVVDVLSGQATVPSRRVWYGPLSRLRAAGGRWNPKWQARYGNPAEGERSGETAWPALESCSCR